MGRYAAGTNVAVERSQEEIRRQLARFDAGTDRFGCIQAGDEVSLVFTYKRLTLRFVLAMPTAEEVPNQARREQECRRRWRVLAHVIKAKLVAVAEGVETFEIAFLAYVVWPDRQTIGEKLLPVIMGDKQLGAFPAGLLGPGEERE